MFRAVQLYTFLDYCQDSLLEKQVLECGAGVWRGLEPLLVRFHNLGYATCGIEISAERLAAARAYCAEHQIDLDIRQGDMRKLSFADASFSFAFSYNSIFHMTKADVAVAFGEMSRVLKPQGICFVNVLSVDDEGFGDGQEVGPGEFLGREAGEEVIHSYYEDREADRYFDGMTVLYKEKRILQRLFQDGEQIRQAYIDYIVQKE